MNDDVTVDEVKEDDVISIESDGTPLGTKVTVGGKQVKFLTGLAVTLDGSDGSGTAPLMVQLTGLTRSLKVTGRILQVGEIDPSPPEGEPTE